MLFIKIKKKEKKGKNHLAIRDAILWDIFNFYDHRGSYGF